jgi:hypothetical protein
VALSEVILWPVAAVMSYIIAALVRWAAGARTRLLGSVVLFLMVMMSAMFLGALLYFAYPGPTGTLLGLWGAAGIMAVSVFPVFWLFVQEVQHRVAKGPEFPSRRLDSVESFAIWVTIAVFAGEFAMGRAFQLASGEAGAVGSGVAGPLRAVASSIASDWFLFPMAAEMGLTVIFLRSRIPRPLAVALGLQAASMFAAPTALAASGWVLGSSVAAGAVMVALFAYVMSLLYRGERLATPVLRYLTMLVVAFAGMAAGLVLWASTGSPALFAVAAVAQMAVFFTTVLVPERFVPDLLTARDDPEPPTGSARTAPT